MAKYNVVFACGHEEEIQLYGPHKNRDKMIAYLQENGKCSACKREQKEQDKKPFQEKTIKSSNLYPQL